MHQHNSSGSFVMAVPRHQSRDTVVPIDRGDDAIRLQQCRAPPHDEGIGAPRGKARDDIEDKFAIRTPKRRRHEDLVV